jgi:hypothetical protein
VAKNPFAALSGGGDNFTSSVSSGVNNRVKQLKDLQDDSARIASQAKSAPAKASSSSSGDNPNAKYGDRPGEKRIDTRSMTKPLGSFKKGGKVKKTGIYKLHKGEKVLNAKQTKKAAKKGGMKAILSGE